MRYSSGGRKVAVQMSKLDVWQKGPRASLRVLGASGSSVGRRVWIHKGCMRGVLDGASWFTSGSRAEVVDLMPQWTMNVHGKCLNQVLEVAEERSMLTNNFTWQITDFPRHVAGETEGRGAITSTYFASIVRCSQWKTSCGGCPPNFEKGAVRTAWVAGGVWSVRRTV